MSTLVQNITPAWAYDVHSINGLEHGVDESPGIWRALATNTYPAMIVISSLAVVLLTRLATSFHFWICSQSAINLSTPVIPYDIPFIGHAFAMALSPYRFFTSTFAQYGFERPLEVKAGTLRFIAIGNPKLIAAVFKASSSLSSQPASILSLKWLLASPPSVIPFYEADKSGTTLRPREGSSTPNEHRINFLQHSTAQKHLSGQSLLALTDRYVKTLERNLNAIRSPSSSAAQWIECPDLYAFLQEQVSASAIETLMDSEILRLAPDLVQDLWTFDTNVPKFLKHLPEVLIPAAYRSRRKLLGSIKNWHMHAH